MNKEWMDPDSLDIEYIDTEINAGNKGRRAGRNRDRSTGRENTYRPDRERTGRSSAHRSAGREDRRTAERSLKEQRRKKRKRKRIIITTAIALLAVALTLVIVMSVLRLRTLQAFKGDYTRTVDVTDRVVSNIAVWLKDVEGADVTAEWIKSRTEPFILTTTISFDPQGLKKGSYTEELNDPSYTDCSERAYALTAECLKELIIKRLTLIGYAESLSDEDADALITEALGMTLDSYIKSAGIKIMPGRDELANEITRSGDYRIDKMTIGWTRAGEDISDTFKTADDTLIIVEPGYIYERSRQKSE